MPNHFTSAALCARDWSTDPDEVDFTPLLTTNLCEAVMPMPQELKTIVSCSPPCRYQSKDTGEIHQSCTPPLGPDSGQWERVPLRQDELAELRRRHGAVTWYDWCIQNWGTKWGAYGVKVHELGGDGAPILIEFQTAWGPPSPEVMGMIDRYLCETYHLANIKWIGHDPGSAETLDIEVKEPRP